MDTSSTEHNVTRLLQAWTNGNQDATEKLFTLIYDELHRMASSYMRQENSPHTLQSTALIHEVFCKIVDQKSVRWQSRTQFFFIAAQSMRRILIDHARKNLALKRGGSALKIALDDSKGLNDQRAQNLIRLDDALTKLSKIDARKSRIVEMKFFGGLTTAQIAAAERTTSRTIEREWRKAKAWLYHEIS